MLAFLHLFKAHPEAKAKFKMFEDIPTDDLNTNEIFQNHAHRVVSVIRKIVAKLDDPPGYLKYLKILGSKHIMFDADVKYIKQMGYMFLSAIQPTLEKEVKNSYLSTVLDATEQFAIIYFRRFGMKILETLGNVC